LNSSNYLLLVYKILTGMLILAFFLITLYDAIISSYTVNFYYFTHGLATLFVNHFFFILRLSAYDQFPST
jgi:hypothetical protein